LFVAAGKHKDVGGRLFGVVCECKAIHVGNIKINLVREICWDGKYGVKAENVLRFNDKRRRK
jgi:hypothetical protein